MRVILKRLKELAAEAEAISASWRPLAKLAKLASNRLGQKTGLPDWPCSTLPSLIRAFEGTRVVPLMDLQRFLGDVAILFHLQEGRDMRAELTAHFGADIPIGFVVQAVAAGRAGVLRPFGIRSCQGEFTPEDLKHARDLVEVALDANRILVDFLASTSTAWPCPWCGGLMTTMDKVYCSPRCAQQDERRTRYLSSKESRKRQRRGD